MPKVSVILPIYNKEKYLDRCINSILHQTLEDIEVILVNDGSSDNSLDICKKYEKLDDRVKVIDQENRGVSAARNSGLTIAKGQFITFVDPDDWIERNMYLRMYNHCINTQADICLCNYYKDNGKKVIPVTINCAQYILTRNEIIHEIMLNMIAPKDIDSKKNSLMGSVWRLMIKKELITKNDINFPLNIPLMEDLIFCLKVFSKATKVCIDSNHHYHYCIQEGSASTVYRSNKFELQLKIMEIVKAILKKEGLYDLSKERLNNRYINLGINSIVNEVHKTNPNKLRYKISNIKRICSLAEIQKALTFIDYKNYTLRKKFVLNAMRRKNAILLYLYYSLTNYI